MNLPTHDHQRQLQDAVAFLAKHMRRHSKGEVTFHLDGKGNLGARATVRVVEELRGRSQSAGIEVSFNQLIKVVAEREAKRANTTKDARTPLNSEG